MASIGYETDQEIPCSMKIFQCSHCANPVFFENVICQKCGYWLGYDHPTLSMYAVPPGSGPWMINSGNVKNVRYCRNHEYDVCNWFVEDGIAEYCSACQLNRTIPNLQMESTLPKWRHFEQAKHRLVYSLKRLGLPLISKMQDEGSGLCFHFIDKEVESKDIKMGHVEGEITILISEADPVKREQIRENLNEKYRTMIGHLRHEIGHYYWQQLISTDVNLMEKFRTHFGDERQDYTQALSNHYQYGPQMNWQYHFISSYASSHAWEDWAETWAHYMHLIDTMETAYYFGLDIEPELNDAQHMYAKATFDPYGILDFKQILDYSIPLFFAMNSINRSMGIADLYPFVISDAVVTKLTCIHEMVQSYRNRIVN